MKVYFSTDSSAGDGGRRWRGWHGSEDSHTLEWAEKEAKRTTELKPKIGRKASETRARMQIFGNPRSGSIL